MTLFDIAENFFARLQQENKDKKLINGMVDKIIAQNETSTSQKFTNLQIIVGDLSASTTCRHQLLRCCDQLAEGVSRCWSWIPFLEENPVPDI